MKCEICAEPSVGPEHEITEKHIRNRVLYDYTCNRQQFAGNRKGVAVSCSAESSFSSVVDYVDAKIKISAKPNEGVKFNFTVKNESKKEDIIVIFIHTAHNKLNFIMNEHGLSFGCNPVTVKAKSTLQREVSVTFKCPDIGQYEVPIIFSFRKVATNEGILIIRDMVVFVEEQQRTHEKIISPYAQKEVKAQKLYKTTMADRSDDLYRIPKNYKPIYASGLKIREDASKEEQDICKDVRDIFATGLTEENYVRFFHNLLWYEETIVRINLKKYNMTNVPLRKMGQHYELHVPGLAEKRPSLLQGDLLFVKPHLEDVMFEAVIKELPSENTILINGLNAAFEEYYNIRGGYDVRFFLSRMPLERMHCAVQAVVKGHPDQRRVFPAAPSTAPPEPQEILKFFNPLVEKNPEQSCAVRHIVSGSSGSAPYLLHGPPGTGKTVTIVEAILQIVARNPQHRVMVCTESNMAADVVATVIIQYAHLFPQEKLLLRANSKFRVWETLPECLHKYSNGSTRNRFEPISLKDFKEYNIVVTTLSHAAKFAREARMKRVERPVTHLFIDEAAQASEPSCLIPICGLLAQRGHLTLAGDPLQLGPVVISHHARKLGLGLSLMERLKTTCALYSEDRNDPNYTLMLRNNFRSDPAVLHIPNDLFYKGQLRALAKEDPLSSVDILGQQPESRAIVFHGVLSKEQKMGKSPSFYNSMELEIVQMYIKRLVEKHDVKPEDIGVVTPYIRQVYQIKKWLCGVSWGARVEVGTVEAYQGKEKRVIIISTVRANCQLLHHDARFQLGFLVDDKRFNVALTRAKAKAIIIGNPLCLEKDAKWRAYIQKCREFGTYCGYDTKADEARKDITDRITPLLKDLKINKRG